MTLAQPYQYLFQRMRQAGWNDGYARRNDALAAAVGLLVHVETDASDHGMAQAMSAHAEGSDQPCVSEARFKRLLETQDLDALFGGLRRTLPLMKKGAPVMALTNDVLSWAWPDQRDAVKKTWAYGYVWPTK
ncbi:MAG: type I-E CRISPR-associated protein Cse2/CasB [Ramlibacter sp.]|nr:type I-E CRISPR-associated protein Cse2/CasB [Ramlibacter sp.]